MCLKIKYTENKMCIHEFVDRLTLLCIIVIRIGLCALVRDTSSPIIAFV